MDNEFLKCNFRKCRKPVSEIAWVTSCSHIFCNEDGTKEFNKNHFSREFPQCLICPACSTQLSGKLDVVRLELNPPDSYKSIILAGLNPDVIMDIASRAMAFWVYQCQNEYVHRADVESKMKERCNKLEQAYVQVTNQFKVDLKTSRNETEKNRQRVSDLSEKLLEKSRQLQKTQAMYENMRRKFLSSDNVEKTRNVDFDKDFPPTLSCPSTGFQDKQVNFAGYHASGFTEYNLGTIPETIPNRDFHLSITQKSAEVNRCQFMDETFNPQIDQQRGCATRYNFSIQKDQ